MIGSIGVKNAKTYSCVCEVTPDGHLNGGNAIVGQDICTSNHGEHVDPGGKTTDTVDILGGKSGFSE